jgi:hypothetical protein
MDIYIKNHGCCEYCNLWFPFNEYSLHHEDTGGMGMKGDEVIEKMKGCCLRCHPD